RSRRVDADQHPQVGQCVEQHVRLELRLEQLELVLRRLALRFLYQRLGAGDAAARIEVVGCGEAGEQRADQQRQRLARRTVEEARRAATGDPVAEQVTGAVADD